MSCLRNSCFCVLILYIECSFIFIPATFSQTIDPTRITDWTSCGSTQPLNPSAWVDMIAAGCDPTGTIPCDAIMDSILKIIHRPGGVYFPEGTYRFNKTIILPDSVSLIGSTLEGTIIPGSKLLLAPGENQHGISITGKQLLLSAHITAPLVKGTSYFITDEPDVFFAGMTIRLHALDDSLLVNNPWGLHATGQILTVHLVEDDTVFFTKPLRRDYDPERLPLIYVLNPARHVHIICLSIERIDATVSQTANIYMQYARDCSVTGIKSRLSNFAHVDVRYSTQISVERCYFTEGHDYGGGGKAYGIMLHSGTGDCLIRDNIFKQLRHSMILQSGANGNVFSYNYSTDPFWTGVLLPSNSAGDMVLHGNYPYMNLFEGNVVQNIVIDNSHGINGPFNTYFRNRAELYGIFMNTNPASSFQNFIGNQVSNTSSPILGLYSLQGTGHFTYGNSIKGNIQPPGSSEPDSISLSDNVFPSFYSVTGTIPPVTTYNVNSGIPLIEAAYRYHFFPDSVSLCAPIEYMPSSLGKNILNSTWMLYPNPVYDRLFLHNVNPVGDHFQYQIFSALGNKVSSGRLDSYIDVSDLVSGIYWIVVNRGHEMSGMRFVKH